MSGRTTLAGWSGILATWLSVGCAIVGGYLGLQAYRIDIAGRADARIVQTFELFSKFNSGEILASRQKILSELYQRSNRENAPTIADNDLFLFVDAFDPVDICTQRNLCDPELVQELFGPYAVGTFEDLRPSIERVRSQEAQFAFRRKFGSGMERIAAQERTLGTSPR